MEITPYYGLGSVHFGDLKDNVRGSLKVRCRPFRKAMGENETDAFDDVGLHVYYDNDDCVIYIEAFHPAEITFRGLRFLGRSLDEVEKDMHALGYIALRTDVGVRYDDVGIAITASNGIVEGVGICCRNYYDE